MAWRLHIPSRLAPPYWRLTFHIQMGKLISDVGGKGFVFVRRVYAETDCMRGQSASKITTEKPRSVISFFVMAARDW